MATPNPFLIASLRETAQRLADGAHYAWGDHGSCNCGNLLQVMTDRTGKDILRIAHTSIGEWTEIAEEWCGVSHLPADRLIGELIEHGLTPTDIRHLEYLDDREVLERLPGGFRWLQRNQRGDVIAYLQTLADLLEEQMDIASAEAAVQQILQAATPVTA
ncbi:MAG: hypothetical protein FJX89_04545 [Bacteroidetes bacterium]|nr:hypothetical protein [Bacteroidota bacterium]